MNPTREEALFDAALDRPTAERAAFLDGACLGDQPLRQRVEALLASHDATANLLHTAASPAPTLRIDFPDDPPDDAVGQTLGRYKLLEKVGEGGCGVVYVAEQTQPVRRRVALKVIKLGMDTKQVVARFEAERQALALMDHPNIAKVLDAGTTEQGRPFFVMELVRGIPITRYCDQANLSTRDRLDLFIKVCQAIQHAHQKGIIHRDIKPSNILVTLHDGVPVPKVIDFGIAKATEGRLTDATVYTQLHQFIGTPAYMSPEQAEMSGLDIDTRSDIYSLGVLLYELLTGQTPFDAQELAKAGIDGMRKTIREKEPQRPSTRLTQAIVAAEVTRRTGGGTEESASSRRRLLELVNLIRGDLDWIVMKCLEKDRVRRYETANGLAADISRHLTNEPVTARPPSHSYRLQKAFRRHRLSFVSAGAVITALVAGLAISAWQTQRARRAESEQSRLHQVAEKALAGETRQHQLAEANARQLDETLYFHRVALAHSELVADRPSAALELLQECPPALRGWEWHLVWNGAKRGPEHFGRATKIPNPGPIRALAVSPNGQDLAVNGGGELQLWSLGQASSPALAVRLGPAAVSSFDEVRWLAFSADGRLLASVAPDFAVELWDVTTRKRIRSLPNSNLVTSLSFHPSGRRIATASRPEPFIRIWDVLTGDLVRTQAVASGATAAHAVTYSPDGRWLAAGTWDGGPDRVFLGEADSGSWTCELEALGNPVADLRFSADSRTLACATVGSRLNLCLYDVASRMRLRTMSGHQSSLATLSFTPDQSRLASTGFDRNLQVWDVRHGRKVLSLAGHQDHAPCAEFTPDGHRLISGGFDGMLRVWDGSPPGRDLIQSEPLTLESPRGEVWCLTRHPDGRLFASGPGIGLRIWRPPWTQPADGKVSSLKTSLSADGRLLASAGSDREGIRILDAATLQSLFRVNVVEDPTLDNIALSPSGEHLVAGGAAGRLFAWKWREGTKATELGSHGTWIQWIAFSPSGDRLATLGEDGMVLGWDPRRLDQPQQPKVLMPPTPLREFGTLAFSPDGQRLATGNGFGGVQVIRLDTGKTDLQIKGAGGIVYAVAFSPDGRWIASGGTDNTVRIWDATTGSLLRTCAGHQGTIFNLNFSLDGLVLASGSGDHTVRLWPLATDFINGRLARPDAGVPTRP